MTLLLFLGNEEQKIKEEPCFHAKDDEVLKKEEGVCYVGMARF